jgi:very-short-patch-repair endonuclease
MKYPLQPGDKFNRFTLICKVRKNNGWEWKCKCSCGNYSVVCSSALVRGVNKSCGCYREEFARRPRTDKEKAKYSLGHKGKPLSLSHREGLAKKMGSQEVRKKLSKAHKGKKWSKLQRKKIMEAFSKEEFRRKNSIRGKAHWQNPEFVKKQMRARGVRPNRLEVDFLSFCRCRGWVDVKYVGDGELVIGGKCPDFCDGKNNLIELFGDYWHRGQNTKDRIRHFSKFGYRCLVIWEKEFRQDQNRVAVKIAAFLKVR